MSNSVPFRMKLVSLLASLCATLATAGTTVSQPPGGPAGPLDAGRGSDGMAG